mgnify:CR=1 FL=1
MSKIGTTPRMKLYNKIHKIIREICLIRHPYCVTCKGQSGDTVLQAGHLISRTCLNTRFDLMNVFTQCRSCNNKHEYRPEIFTQWFIKEYGIEEYNLLVNRSKQICKLSLKELEEILQIMKNLLDKMK